MSIHISSGHCVSTPDFNIAEDNKIKSAECKYNRIFIENKFLFEETYEISGMTNGETITPESKILGNYDESYLYYVNDEYKYAQIKKTIDLGDYISRFNLNDIENLHIILTAKVKDGDKEQTYYESSTNNNVSGLFRIMSGNISVMRYDYPNEVKLEGNETILKNDLWLLAPSSIDYSISKNKIIIMFGLNCVFSSVNERDFNSITIRIYSQDKGNITNTNDDSFYIYGVEQSTKKGTDFEIVSNELFNNQITINSVNYVDKFVSNMVSKWANGRQTMSLTCIYGRYYSYDADTLSKDSNEVVLNGADGRMIEVGDIVVPTRLYTNTLNNTNYELPIAVDKDGNALEFEVLSSEIEFNNGRLVTHLKLMEVK